MLFTVTEMADAPFLRCYRVCKLLPDDVAAPAGREEIAFDATTGRPVLDLGFEVEVAERPLIMTTYVAWRGVT